MRQLTLLAAEPPLAAAGHDAGDDGEAERLAAEVGANIARWRGLRGMTQRQLARRLGCDHSAVSLWEAGRRLPSLAHLIAPGRVFRCGARSLLQSDDR